MEGEHAQMWQIPCKMTNSSSQTVANTRQMVPAKKSKKNPKPAQKKILKLFHTLFSWRYVAFLSGWGFHQSGTRWLGTRWSSQRKSTKSWGLTIVKFPVWQVRGTSRGCPAEQPGHSRGSCGNDAWERKPGGYAWDGDICGISWSILGHIY